MNKVKEKHPSFGMISWGRSQCHGVELFGSDLKHSELIHLEIETASRERDLSKTWIHGEKTIVELYMSAHQFTQFITTPNTSGAPCTIRATREDGYIKYVGHSKEEELHRDEFKERIDTIKARSKGVIDRMNELAEGKTISKGNFKELQNMVKMMLQEYHSNLPFVEDSFKKAMDKTVEAGKCEIEAYINQRVHEAGLEALAGDKLKVLSNE